MSMEIQLINQIEKFECLYNFNLPQYNRKDLTDEAWANIAANTNLTVSDCKEKWRNIRSSFLRSMKPCGSKVKKPYYLREYLKFILPFLKPINIENADEVHYEIESNITPDPEVVVDFIKPEPEEYVENDATVSNTENDDTLLSDLLTPKSPVLRRKRRFITTRHRIKATHHKNDTTHEGGNSSAIKMFLMSLLPELETMSEQQIRLFKIKSMTLIDDIKMNYTQMRRNMGAVNSERLQKRLINLLLKNLQRTSEDT